MNIDRGMKRLKTSLPEEMISARLISIFQKVIAGWYAAPVKRGNIFILCDDEGYVIKLFAKNISLHKLAMGGKI
ncbi:hypothetical protein Mahau_1950 [Mahella australiensis 50-1 BON]|jgi:mannose/fructose/N-acetylgalactosamine-specific phosphotransferase system component IIB|uniref:Uncharacterized protein n=2 Tax=Mahella TaxID=252965 RepID=F4A1S6_MAHA5|nr:hypothetical protein Mahau_1950 [Mahella australiensis 50-1 BON]